MGLFEDHWWSQAKAENEVNVVWIYKKTKQLRNFLNYWCFIFKTCFFYSVIASDNPQIDVELTILMWLNASERNQGTNLLKTRMFWGRHAEEDDDSESKKPQTWPHPLGRLKIKEACRAEGCHWGRQVLTQTQACPKGDDIILVNSQRSELVLQSQIPDLSAHQELIHFFQGHIQRHQTLRDSKTRQTVH